MSALNQDRIGALLMACLGIVLLQEGFRLPMMIRETPGPGFFPLVLGGLTLVLSLVLFLVTREPRRSFVEDRTGLRRVGLSSAGFLAYLLLLNLAGFLVATLLFVGFVVGWVERRGWRATALASLGIALGCQLLFRVWLAVPLPGGLLGI